MGAQEREQLEIDPYAAVRPALAPDHSSLEAGEVSTVLGPLPASVALHETLNSPEMRSAALAGLLGTKGRSSVLFDGAEISIPAYLRMVSRLCHEVAEQSEWVPSQEQLIGLGSVTLSAPVGRTGKNFPDDVKQIQRLLNSNLPLPSPLLAENGVVDAATIAAIEEYQRKVLGKKTPDGRIDPGGTTLKSLIADKLCFLPHWCKPLAGPAVRVDATQMNPGFLTSTSVNRDPGLQAIVARRVLAKPELVRLRFALVDLTGADKLASPKFAGNQETLQGGLGSMSKIACMYAAYQLKFDLEELSRQRSITNEKDLFDAARELWQKTQKPDPAHTTSLFPSDPDIDLQGKLVVIEGKPVEGVVGLSLPDLEQIFTTVPGPSTGLTLRFKGSDRILVDPSAAGSPVDETPEVKAYSKAGGEALGQVRKLSFAERLFLMIDKSDNAAAHSCLEKLGFLYLTSAIWQSDFYRPERGGGIWEASTHDGGHRWIKPPVPRHNPKNDFVSANACSVAAILTLIEQGRLVNPEACKGMKHLMDKNKSGVPQGSHTRSYFKEGLASLPVSRIHSKLGIGHFLNDAAIIVRPVQDPENPASEKQIRYVAAGFDDPSPAKARVPARFLNQLIVELDKCIRENNGVLSPSAP